MSLIHILIMDRDPYACPEDHCGRLATLLHGLASASAIRMQSVTRLSSETLSPAPDLILLRPSITENLPEVVQCLRGSGSPVPILGLFCIGKDTPAVVLQACGNDLEDFLTCPFRAIDVFPRVQRLLWGKGETTATPQAAEMQAQFHFDSLVGESDPFLRVLQVVNRIAHADTTVLISGETGTGKELVAQAIHYHSLRRGKPFVPVNCGALPDHLVENELFGHARGA
jgi:transcriptional regulator with GAF, ATPase, and Fis domain